MADAANMASTTPKPTATVPHRQEAPQAPIPEELMVETFPGNGAVLPDNPGLALFSTNSGQRAKRKNYLGQPRQIRSDRRDSIINKATSLREQYAELCISITASDLKDPGLLQKYYDNFDIHFYSPKFLFDLLSYIVKTNEFCRDERAAEVDRISRWWIAQYPEAFDLFESDHQWFDLFPGDDFIQQHGFPFLWDTFWRIASIKEAETVARTMGNVSTDIEPKPAERGTRAKQDRLQIIIPPPRPRRLSAPQQPHSVEAMRAPVRVPPVPNPAALYGTLQTRNPSGGVYPSDGSLPSSISGQRVGSHGSGPHPPVFMASQSPVIYQPFGGPPTGYIGSPATPVSGRYEGSRIPEHPPPKRGRHTHSDSIQDTWNSEYGAYPRVIERSNPIRHSNPPGSRFSPASIPREFPPGPSKGQRTNQKRPSFSSETYERPSRYRGDMNRPTNGMQLDYRPPQRPGRTASFSQGHQQKAYDPPVHGFDGIENVRNMPGLDEDWPAPSALNPFAIAEVQEGSSTFAPVIGNTMSTTPTRQKYLRRGDRSSQKSPTKSLRLKSSRDTFIHSQFPSSRGSPEKSTNHDASVERKLWIGKIPPQMRRGELLSVLAHIPGFIDVMEPRSTSTGTRRWTFAEFATQEDRDLIFEQSDRNNFTSCEFIMNLPRPRGFGRYSRPYPYSDKSQREIEEQPHKLQEAYDNTESITNKQSVKTQKRPQNARSSQDSVQQEAVPKSYDIEVGVDTASSQARHVHHNAGVGESLASASLKSSDGPPQSTQDSLEATKQGPSMPAVKGKKSNEQPTAKPLKEGKTRSNAATETTDAPKGAQARPLDIKGTSTDFPPLSKLIKPAIPLVPIASKPVQKSKSFAQIVGPTKSPVSSSTQNAPKADDSVKVSEIIETKVEGEPSVAEDKVQDEAKNNSAPLQTPTALVEKPEGAESVHHEGATSQSAGDIELDDTKRTPSVQHAPLASRDQLREEISSDVAQTKTPKTPKLSVNTPHAVVPSTPDQLSQEDSQPMTRDLSRTLDTGGSFSPGQGVSTEMTTFEQSPTADDKSDNNVASNIQKNDQSDEALNANALRTRLEDAARREKAVQMAVKEKNTEASVQPTSTKPQESSTEVPTLEIPKSNASTIQSPPPESPLKEASHLIEAQTESLIKAQKPLTPIAGPGPTHKKKHRSRVTTPSKKSLSSSNVPPPESKTLASASSAEATAKSQYPSMTSDRVTVVSLPVQDKPKALRDNSSLDDRGQVTPRSDSLVDQLHSFFEQRKRKDDDPLLLQGQRESGTKLFICQQPELLTAYTDNISLAQRIAHKPSPPAIGDAKHQPSGPSQTSAGCMKYDDQRFQKHVATTLRMEYILRKMVTWTEVYTEEANCARGLLDESPLRRIDNLHAEASLRQFVRYNADHSQWVENLPSRWIFDREMAERITQHYKWLKAVLYNYRTIFDEAHKAGVNPSWCTSEDLCREANDLLEQKPRQNFLQYDETKWLVDWNVDALGFANRQSDGGLRPNTGPLPVLSRLAEILALPPHNDGSGPPNKMSKAQSARLYPLEIAFLFEKSQRVPGANSGDNGETKSSKISLTSSSALEMSFQEWQQDFEADETQRLKEQILMKHSHAEFLSKGIELNNKPVAGGNDKLIRETNVKSKRKLTASKVSQKSDPNDSSQLSNTTPNTAEDAALPQHGHSSSDETLRNASPPESPADPSARGFRPLSQRPGINIQKEIMREYAAKAGNICADEATLETMILAVQPMRQKMERKHPEKLKNYDDKVEAFRKASTTAEIDYSSKEMVAAFQEVSGMPMPPSEPSFKKWSMNLLDDVDHPEPLTLEGWIPQHNLHTGDNVLYDSFAEPEKARLRQAMREELEERGWWFTVKDEFLYRTSSQLFSRTDIDQWMFNEAIELQLKGAKENPHGHFNLWDEACIPTLSPWGFVDKSNAAKMIKERLAVLKVHEEQFKEWLLQLQEQFPPQENLVTKESKGKGKAPLTPPTEADTPASPTAMALGGNKDAWGVPTGETEWGMGGKKGKGKGKKA
ncbi:uncharacterized protein KY384_006382 [Bacidia gigantensis]|uniref:uncharacterized protein n=1 Tax=Bacidia gigantensis TaxID=2732470 RepID=UPI001D04FA0B|nr:uncharacterized protein KY384_006382 [Bacidia gigantensis]KAG8528695.1 hypothetical protein KY384_006382 [Bacidia gigantensis]